MRTAPLLLAAVTIPLALALAWIARDTPPVWPCFTEEPTGQAEAIAGWRTGLGPALVAATLLLAALAARLSADRRRACGASWRPGIPTLVAGGVTVAGAVVAGASGRALDELADAVFLLLVISPVAVLAALSCLAWIVWTPVGVKGAAAAQLGIWACVFVTFLVAGVIAEAGLEEWCLD